MAEGKTQRSPLAVAVAGLILPGLGYALVGERRRAAWVGSAIGLMFLLGLLIAGVRVIEVPGWGDDGRKIYYETRVSRDGQIYMEPVTEPAISVELGGGTEMHPLYKVTRRTREGGVREETVSEAPLEPSRWVLWVNFRGEIFNHIWFVPQALMGAPTAAAGYFSVMAAAAGVAKSHARLAEIGTLFTTVAGMLNLLAVIGAASRAERSRHE